MSATGLERHRVAAKVQAIRVRDGERVTVRDHRYCPLEGCEVGTDNRSDCGQDACRHCGFGGVFFHVGRKRGGVRRFTCDECDRTWTQ